MMTNAKGGLEPSVSGTGAPQNLTLYPTAADAESNTLTLFVDRVAAKVRVQASKTSDVATIGDVYWVLNVKNKKYFPVSKRTKTFFDNATPHDIHGPNIPEQADFSLQSLSISSNWSGLY